MRSVPGHVPDIIQFKEDGKRHEYVCGFENAHYGQFCAHQLVVDPGESHLDHVAHFDLEGLGLLLGQHHRRTLALVAKVQERSGNHLEVRSELLELLRSQFSRKVHAHQYDVIAHAVAQRPAEHADRLF